MRTRLALVLALALLSAPLVAQESQSPQGQGMPSNIRLDLTITDTYAEPAASKTVTMLVLDGAQGIIRTSNKLPPLGHQVELNVDAAVNTLRPGVVRVRLTVEYTPPQQALNTAEQRFGPAQLNESLTVVLRDGQKVTVSQSADPATDRKVMVELTATVVK